MIDTDDYRIKKNKKMEYASNKYQNIFKEDKQKIMEHKKNRIEKTNRKNSLKD